MKWSAPSAAGEEILRFCIEEGGSITGEHGVGMEKMELIGEQFPDETLEMIAAFEVAVRSRVPAESRQNAADRKRLHGDPPAGRHGSLNILNRWPASRRCWCDFRRRSRPAPRSWTDAGRHHAVDLIEANESGRPAGKCDRAIYAGDGDRGLLVRVFETVLQSRSSEARSEKLDVVARMQRIGRRDDAVVSSISALLPLRSRSNPA